MYAVIKTGGKQYKVAEGDVLKVEKINAEVDSTVELNDVLMIAGDAGMTVGSPIISGASVSAKVLSQGKGPKVINFKYKPKKATSRKKGHRQLFTEIEITSIKG